MNSIAKIFSLFFFLIFQDNITVIQEHSNQNEHCNYLIQVYIPDICSTVKPEKKGISGGGIFLIM